MKFMLLTAFLLSIQCQAQFSGLSVSATEEASWVKFNNEALASDLAALPRKDPHRSELTELYQSNTDLLNDLVKEHLIVTDSQFVNYLKGVTTEIFRSNPDLPADKMRLGIYRNPVPNAASYGQGTILLHTGLLTRIRNESQLAFILCHEISHYYLKHRQRSLETYFNRIDSKEFKARLAAIRKSQYKQGQQLSELIFDHAFASGRHSRGFEAEADSMALVIFSKTRYDINEPPSTLLLLDSLDKPKFPGEVDYAKALNLPSYPFKTAWLTSNTTLSFAVSDEEKNKKKQLADSLKTHPDCPLRASRIRLALSQNASGGKYLNLSAGDILMAIQQRIDLDLPQYYLDQNQPGRAIQEAFRVKDRASKEMLLIASKAFVTMAEAQKNHKLGSMLEQPDAAEYDADYNQLLIIYSNMRVGEMIQFAYEWCQAAKAQLGSSSDFQKIFTTITQLKNS